MDDLISKQDKRAVVNLIDNMNAISFYEANEHSKECYYEIRNAILAMPEQEPKWIPCSDRLPKESGEYLVSVIDDSGEDDDYEAVDVAWFAHKKDYYIEDSEWRRLGIDETVIAWMPKPAPYKAESEEV